MRSHQIIYHKNLSRFGGRSFERRFFRTKFIHGWSRKANLSYITAGWSPLNGVGVCGYKILNRIGTEAVGL
jgi:hypothetical protein